MDQVLDQRLEEALAAARERVVTLPPPAMRRLLRVQADLKQRELAAVVGVHRVSLARWENGTREPIGKIRADYAQVLAALQGKKVR